MDREEILHELKAERDRIDDAIGALEGGSSKSIGKFRITVQERPVKRSHRLTPAGRRRLSQMMKKRWAERRKQNTRRGVTSTSRGKAQVRRRRNRLTPAGRKRLSEMMKARWAARRKNASKTA